MSSANQVEIIGVPEVTYGTTPALATAAALTFRFTSESISGSPTTVESAELRTDRMSSGQVMVGLETGGDLECELSADRSYDVLFGMGMMNDWTLGVGNFDTVNFAPDGTNPQAAHVTFTLLNIDNIDTIGRKLEVGDLIRLEGFEHPENNGVCQILSRTPPHDLFVVCKRGTVLEASAPDAIAWSVPDNVEIGTIQKSITLSKAYNDVQHPGALPPVPAPLELSQRYTGALVSGFNVDAKFGAIITAGFTFAANGYVQEIPALHEAITAAGGTVEPPGTTSPLNASVDIGMITVDGLPTDFCIQSIQITLDNGLSPQNCIGRLAPSKYALGTAGISVTMSIYLGTSSYQTFMPKKLTQEPIGVLFEVHNADGGYAFEIPALQLNFPDPSAGGANQQVTIEAAGVAKVGPNGESALRIHKIYPIPAEVEP